MKIYTDYDYTEEIIAILTGTKFDIPREHLEWTGITTFQEWWGKEPKEIKDKIVSAMEKLITTSRDKRLMADLCYLAYILKIYRLEPSIKKLAKSFRGKDEILQRQTRLYLQWHKNQ